MTGCGCHSIDHTVQRRTLWLALALNATMFAVGIVAGIAAQSSGLIADALDMLADAAAYGIALLAMSRGDEFKARSATFTGVVLIVLGIGVLADAGRRALFGSEPEGAAMMIIASLSLAVNATVLYLLTRMRNKEVHLRATTICTQADVIANLGVILSGLVVLTTGFHLVDLIAGIAIGLYVIKEAFEILGDARQARKAVA